MKTNIATHVVLVPLVVGSIWLASDATEADQELPRLCVSANGHFLVTADGKPFFWLGERYRTAGVVWILGGDRKIRSAAERNVIDAMAQGLREGDGGAHLITFHPRGPGQSSAQLHDASWLDLNMNQSSHGARDHDNGLFTAHDYALTPPKPTIDGEPRYEQIAVGFYWFDPRYGTACFIHTGDAVALQTFAPPDAGRGRDWVLVLDHAARDFPTPGAKR